MNGFGSGSPEWWQDGRREIADFFASPPPSIRSARNSATSVARREGSLTPKTQNSDVEPRDRKGGLEERDDGGSANSLSSDHLREDGRDRSRDSKLYSQQHQDLDAITFAPSETRETSDDDRDETELARQDRLWSTVLTSIIKTSFEHLDKPVQSGIPYGTITNLEDLQEPRIESTQQVSEYGQEVKSPLSRADLPTSRGSLSEDRGTTIIGDTMHPHLALNSTGKPRFSINYQSGVKNLSIDDVVEDKATSSTNASFPGNPYSSQDSGLEINLDEPRSGLSLSKASTNHLIANHSDTDKLQGGRSDAALTLHDLKSTGPATEAHAMDITTGQSGVPTEKRKATTPHKDAQPPRKSAKLSVVHGINRLPAMRFGEGRINLKSVGWYVKSDKEEEMEVDEPDAGNLRHSISPVPTTDASSGTASSDDTGSEVRSTRARAHQDVLNPRLMDNIPTLSPTQTRGAVVEVRVSPTLEGIPVPKPAAEGAGHSTTAKDSSQEPEKKRTVTAAHSNESSIDSSPFLPVSVPNPSQAVNSRNSRRTSDISSRELANLAPNPDWYQALTGAPPTTGRTRSSDTYNHIDNIQTRLKERAREYAEIKVATEAAGTTTPRISQVMLEDTKKPKSTGKAKLRPNMSMRELASLAPNKGYDEAPADVSARRSATPLTSTISSTQTNTVSRDSSFTSLSSLTTISTKSESGGRRSASALKRRMDPPPSPVKTDAAEPRLLGAQRKGYRRDHKRDDNVTSSSTRLRSASTLASAQLPTGDGPSSVSSHVGLVVAPDVPSSCSTELNVSHHQTGHMTRKRAAEEKEKEKETPKEDNAVATSKASPFPNTFFSYTESTRGKKRPEPDPEAILTPEPEMKKKKTKNIEDKETTKDDDPAATSAPSSLPDTFFSYTESTRGKKWPESWPELVSAPNLPAEQKKKKETLKEDDTAATSCPSSFPNTFFSYAESIKGKKRPEPEAGGKPTPGSSSATPSSRATKATKSTKSQGDDSEKAGRRRTTRSSASLTKLPHMLSELGITAADTVAAGKGGASLSPMRTRRKRS